jgi:uncharacterized membrane protein
MQIAPIKFLKSLNWRIILAGLCAVATLHVLAVFTEPHVARANAFHRLEAALPLNRMVLLPPVTAEAQPLPFLSPDARYAMCRFSTENGPVAVRAALLGPGWILTVYSQNGESLNTTLAAPDQPRTDVALKLMPSDDRFMGLTPQARGVKERATASLPVGAKSGIIVVRAPDKGTAFQEIHDAALLQASCRQLSER